jgi:hypothetical protein
MNTAARLWLLLTAFYALAHGILFILVWRTVDLRLEVIVQYIAIPFLQAAGLAWVAGGFHLKDAAQAVWQIFSRPVTALLWCAEGILLSLYWGPGSGANFTEMVARAAGIEALAAIGIILIRVLPSVSLGTWMAILPFAMVVSALGTNGIRPWFDVLFLWLPDGWSFLLKQMVVLGATVISFIAFAGKAQSVLLARSPVAGMMLGWVQIFFIVAAMALVINGYLFGFLISPWREIIATSLSLAATSLLTAALFCLLPGREANQLNMPSTGSRTPQGYPGFIGLWGVLVICAIAATILLRILFFPHWDWDLPALLSLTFIPLIQTSWFRWVHALRTGWRAVFGLAKRQSLLSTLLLTEVVFFCAIAFPRDLWGKAAFGVGVAIWVGLKLVILGSALLKATVADGLCKIIRRVDGAGAVICGIGVACTGRFPNAPWMMAALGSVLILLAVWRPVHPTNTARLAEATAEACLVPILAMAISTLVTWADPMGWLPWIAYSLMAFSTTFLAIGLREARNSL